MGSSNEAPSQGLAHLILAVQFLVWYVCWEIGMKQCAESQPVVPAAAEVCNVDILRGKTKGCSVITSMISRFSRPRKDTEPHPHPIT